MPHKSRQGEFSTNWKSTAEGTTPKTKATTKRVIKPRKTAKPRMTRAADEAFRATSTKRPSRSAENKLVTFVLDAPSGRSVSIAGTFNNWEPEAMVQWPGGLWRIAKKLAPGTYQYRFLVDTEWRADPKNPRMVGNADGGFDSVCQVL